MLRSIELKNSISALQIEIKNGIEQKIDMTEKASELDSLMSEYQQTLEAENKQKNNNKEKNPEMDKKIFNKVLCDLLSGRPVDEAEKSYIPRMVDVATGNYNASGEPGKGAYLVSEEFLPLDKQNEEVGVDLSQYCRDIAVTKPSGKVPIIDMDQEIELADFNSDTQTEIEKKSAVFGQVPYSLGCRGAVIPVSEDLIADADADVLSVIYEIYQIAYIKSKNKDILTEAGKTSLTNASVDMTTVACIDAIKEAFLKTLPIQYGKVAKIYMNQTNFVKLGALKDKTGRHYIQPIVTDPEKYAIDGHEIVVFDDSYGVSDIFVGDFKGILNINRKGLELNTDASSGFKTYSINTRAITRFQEKMVNTKAIVKLTPAA